MGLRTSSGGLGKWGFPATLYNYETGEQDSGGMIWYGKNPPTDSDYALLDAKFGKGNYQVDIRSVVGKKDPRWSTFRKANRQEPQYNQLVRFVGWFKGLF